MLKLNEREVGFGSLAGVGRRRRSRKLTGARVQAGYEPDIASTVRYGLEMVIYHICPASTWAAASEDGCRPASFDGEGFIHCSTPDQVVEVANYLFRGQRNLILMVIDPERVISPIRYEDAGNGKLYPHIYGSLNSSAVIATVPFEPNADGTFDVPRLLG